MSSSGDLLLTSMHMLSKKNLSSAEMDTLKRSRTPVTVVTGNGEVQTTEEAQVYVYDIRSVRDCAITRRNPSSSIAW